MHEEKKIIKEILRRVDSCTLTLVAATARTRISLSSLRRHLMYRRLRKEARRESIV